MINVGALFVGLHGDVLMSSTACTFCADSIRVICELNVGLVVFLSACTPWRFLAPSQRYHDITLQLGGLIITPPMTKSLCSLICI